MLGIDLNQWFYDPEGDPIYLTGLSGTNSKLLNNLVDPDPLDLDPEPIDVLRLDFDGFGGSFSGQVDVFISDHRNSDIGTVSGGGQLRAQLQFSDIDWGDSGFFLPNGVTLITTQDRSDVGADYDSNGGRDIDSNFDGLPDYPGWRDRWASWLVEETSSSEIDHGALNFTADNSSIDLISGQVKAFENLGLRDAFDEVPASIGGLIYDAQSVQHKQFSNIKITRPEAETRDITSFRIKVRTLDHSKQLNDGTYLFSTDTYATAPQFLFELEDPKANEFELTVPLDKLTDMLSSGVLRYQITIDPIFATPSTDFDDKDLRLRASGQVTVLKQTRNEPSDFNPGFSGTATYHDFAPSFGDGWQLSGIPRLVYSTNEVNAAGDVAFSNFTDGPVAKSTVSIHMPGDENPAVFLSSITNSGAGSSLYSFSSIPSFSSYDLQFTGTNEQEYGSLNMTSDHKFIYTDAVGTTYHFERFNHVEASGSLLDDVAAPEWLITKIDTPDGSGVKIAYQNSSNGVTPSQGNSA